MKKNIILMIFLISLNTFSDDYTLDEKTVLGEDKTEAELSIEIDDNIEKKEFDEDFDIELKKEKLDALEELGIDSVKIESNYIESEEKINYNIVIEPEKEVIIDNSKEEVIKKRESKTNEDSYLNYFVFSTGGYKRIDAFQYIIDYTDQNDTDLIDYYLHLGRDISGEYRENTNISLDNYFGQIWYKDLDFSVSHIIKENDYPGIISNPVSSKKTLENTNLNLGYKTKLGKNQDLLVNLNYLGSLVNADRTEREYSNNYFSIKTIYDRYLTFDVYDNFLKFYVEYSNDKLKTTNEDGNQTSIVLDVYNRMIIRDIDWELTGEFGVETINREGDYNISQGDTNYKFLIEGSKKISSSGILGFGVNSDSVTKNYNNFLRVQNIYDDILPALDLKNDNNFSTHVMYETDIMNDFYISGKYSYNISEDKILYKEDSTIPNEIALKPFNLAGEKSWHEILLNFSYNKSNVKGESSYIYSSGHNHFTFVPQHEAKFNFIYKKEKYTGTMLYNIYSKQIIDLDSNKTIPTYGKLDLKNSYKVNDTIAFNIDINNIFNTIKNYKTDYPRSGRKVMCQIEVKY